eukprot:2774799-Pyramimonas_sp.AAC.1
MGLGLDVKEEPFTSTGGFSTGDVVGTAPWVPTVLAGAGVAVVGTAESERVIRAVDADDDDDDVAGRSGGA